MLRKVDTFVLKSFIGPLILTFFIVLIILLLQFLWMYVDELAGKGLNLVILAELIYYFSLTFVPMALPLAILLASLMTFGNMGEFSELAALKSSGISLQRIMRPLMIFIGVISIVSFFFSNDVLPYATSKARTLLYDIRRKKPDINIQAGPFYNGVPDFSIKVTSKDPVSNRLEKLIIYDHREKRGNVAVTVADSGYMKTTQDGSGLIMTLFNGYTFNEIDEKNISSSDRSFPSRKDYFREQTIVMPLQGFDLERSQDGLFKSSAAMMNISDLTFHIDSLGKAYNNRVSSHFNDFKSSKIYHLGNYAYLANITKTKEDSLRKSKYFEPKVLFDSLPLIERKDAITRAIEYIKDGNIYLAQISESHYWEIKVLKKYEVEWNKKLTMSFACLVFFFIGAPLGAIIRKGGLGTPAVISILFFVIYYVISLSGQKLAEENIIGTFAGMWAASYILLPIGLFLTYKATTDSVIMNIDTYLLFFKKIKDTVYRFTMNEKINKSEEIIIDSQNE